MRFSILFALQLPRPWEAPDERRMLHEALEQMESADRLGYDTAWVPEHHFLEELSHAAAPGVLLGAAATRTKDIRLGFGGLVLDGAEQQPARVAEMAATLDLISDGRVELGTTGTGWDAGIGAAAEMLVAEPFPGAAGPQLTLPPRNMVPKPLQRPHPPLWLAGSGRADVRRAATHGVGALNLGFVSPEQAGAWADEYYKVITSDACVPVGRAVNANLAVALPMMVHADEAQAIERGIDGAHFFAYATGHYAVFGEHRPGRTSVWDEFLARRDDVGYARSAITADGAALSVKVLRGGLGSLRGAIGTPAQLRELVARYEAAGVDELVLVVASGRTRHGHVLEALELFAAEVAPDVVARRAARAQAKRERLGDAERRALARRPVPAVADPAYAFGARWEDAEASEPSEASEPHLAPEPEPAAEAKAPRQAGGLSRALQAHGEQAFRAFVRRASDRRLEQTIGSGPGLKTMFAQMEQRFVPDAARGFAGDIQYDLRTADGTVRPWTVTIDSARARAHPGPSEDPTLTIALTIADFARLAAGELDPVKALLGGQLDLAGDFTVALRLAEMFGQAGPG